MKRKNAAIIGIGVVSPPYCGDLERVTAVVQHADQQEQRAGGDAVR